MEIDQIGNPFCPRGDGGSRQAVPTVTEERFIPSQDKTRRWYNETKIEGLNDPIMKKIIEGNEQNETPERGTCHEIICMDGHKPSHSALIQSLWVDAISAAFVFTRSLCRCAISSLHPQTLDSGIYSPQARLEIRPH